MPQAHFQSGTALACLSAALPTEEGPPAEFRIFPRGKLDTQKGGYLFDETAARLVMAASEQWGVEHSLDYEHAALSVPPTPAPAAGWFDLEARDDGLWAVNVRWTDKAAAHLSAREYRYFSPTFNFDSSAERRITSLINIALTNTPAIRRLEPLMSASVRPAIDSRKNTAALKASFSEIEESVREAIRSHFGGTGDFIWVVEVYDDHAIFERDDKLFSAPYTFDGTTATVSGAPVEVRRVYEAVDGEEPAEGSETDTEGDAPVAPSGDLAALSALTGRSTESESLAVVRAWKESASQVAALGVRVQELEAAAESREREALVAQGMAEKKLTPALKAWASTQTVAALKAFLAAAPRIAALSATPVKEEAASAAGGKVAGQRWEEMRPIDKHRLAKAEPETYAALKADFEARQKHSHA